MRRRQSQKPRARIRGHLRISSMTMQPMETWARRTGRRGPGMMQHPWLALVLLLDLAIPLLCCWAVGRTRQWQMAGLRLPELQHMRYPVDEQARQDGCHSQAGLQLLPGNAPVPPLLLKQHHSRLHVWVARTNLTRSSISRMCTTQKVRSWNFHHAQEAEAEAEAEEVEEQLLHIKRPSRYPQMVAYRELLSKQNLMARVRSVPHKPPNHLLLRQQGSTAAQLSP
jgi:hypothetical protein